MTSQTIRRVGSAALERRRAKITAEIATLGLPLPGSLVERRTRHAEWFCLASDTSRLEVAMLEVVVLRVLFLQAINRRTPCSLWIPVSPKLSGRPSKATYHHGPSTPTHWAATGCASRTGTASKGSSFGWSPAAPGTSQPGSVRPVRPPCGRRTEWLAAGVFDKLVEEAIAGYDKIIAPGPIRGRRRRPA